MARKSPAKLNNRISPQHIRAFARDTAREIVAVNWGLFKIAFPITVAIEFLNRTFGFTEVVGEILTPVMTLVGLPGEVSVVWATAIFIQMYAAFPLLAAMWSELNLSVAQITVLATMMLIAHSIPVEIRIVQKAGVHPLSMLVLRLVGAFAAGATLNFIYASGGWLQEPAEILWLQHKTANEGWGDWFTNAAVDWAYIFMILSALILIVRLMKVTGAERIAIVALSPLMKPLGIGKEAMTITIAGMTLGLSLGGAMLIFEGKSGRIPVRDKICAIALLCLCHSIVEDTIATMLLGAHLSGILWGRIIFSIVVVFILSKALRRMDDRLLNRFFVAADS